MTTESKVSKRKTVLRLSAVEDSEWELLYHYILNSSKLGSRELVNRSLRSFWLPFAYRETEKFSEADLKEVALDCLAQLYAQMLLISERFEVTPQFMNQSPHTGSATATVISNLPDSRDTPEPEVPVLNSPEFFDYDDSAFMNMLRS
ncbi:MULTISPECIES: hypothetical protein [Leptolyngbya]|jgi:hypothetical protein|uniref:Uncharacterized protein n=1 Tax=Leptolyngbya boryana NIES-2135 TaxID=1973484 RepID=A0A1Z4JSY6_LEPBY|nr:MULTISPECIES: hypothetical protein [Leptolyngbya]BAY59844.1 hypothetical protein NIES2135_67210 [Leptolyngbya boryana NIES-2135]MBD2369605.1 hypothetical protein [Leptolyngbya sp. FACHB-161]MBD2375950.1 hypothetical protein [Leptolyngbya sp. FACHB-238]MBD2400226.1 hypothetical protein [Leptolyngbya sp. FACHB-239]MBD2406767.1 hypothetical protein [Leptolyngbya sp. FACHB-402]